MSFDTPARWRTRVLGGVFSLFRAPAPPNGQPESSRAEPQAADCALAEVVQRERLLALGDMSRALAHDLNDAISPIQHCAESLLERDNGLSADAQAQLRTIALAANDLATMAGRMREFCRPHEAQLAAVAVELNPLVQEVVELTRARWSDQATQQGHVIKLRTELAPELPPVAGVDSEIRQALVSLVHNALDAMPHGGVLSLRTSSARSALGEREVRVEVLDSGVGMDEEASRRCLEPFFTTKQHRGAGLGLAIVYGTAQRHGAELEIRSAPGQGCSVALSFPHLAGPAVGNAWVPASARLCPGGRVLLIDDDGQVLQALQGMLAPSGHCVVAFDSDQAAIDAFLAAQARGTPFSAVITELGMPGVDVAQLARAIKQASPQTPVIVLTGWGASDNPSHLRDVDHVLGKPPCLRALRDALSLQQPVDTSAGAWPPAPR